MPTLRLYRVTFTFDDSYTPKTECFRDITLVVLADGQFSALTMAWSKLDGLELPEPKAFSATRVERD